MPRTGWLPARRPSASTPAIEPPVACAVRLNFALPRIGTPRASDSAVSCAADALARAERPLIVIGSQALLVAGEARRIADAVTRLQTLKRMLDEKLISQAEFDAKKKAILDSV